MPGGFPLGLELCNGNDQGTDTANSRGTGILCGASGVYGSYVQLVASTPYDTSMMALSVGCLSTGLANQNNVSMNLAVGAGGSEVNIVSGCLICMSGTTTQMVTMLLPLSIPAGTRISAQFAGAGAGTDTLYTQLQLFDAAFTHGEGYSGMEAVGRVGNGTGTSCTSGAANTKGNFSQLIASTTRDYAGFIAFVDSLGSAIPKGHCLWDIAIGAAASEVIILPNHWVVPDGNNPTYRDYRFYPIPIPAGSRVAARFQDPVGSITAGVALLGVYQ